MARKKKPADDEYRVNTGPPGWFISGEHPFQYKAELDTAIFHSGTRSCRITGLLEKPAGWCALEQGMKPTMYLGKRIRMNFWLRTQDLSNYVTGWMRVNVASGRNSFDNMCNRKIRGTNDWLQSSIVLEVPQNSTYISFGLIYNGIGTVWADDFSIEIVDESVPVTFCYCSNNGQPRNLNFELFAEEDYEGV